MELFSSIQIKNWRQFGHLDIDLSNQFTVLTGQNGSGKTTILNILGHHFGWNINLVSTPYLGKKEERRFFSDVYRSRAEKLSLGPDDTVEVGSITYDNGEICNLITSRNVAPQYQLKYNRAQPVQGLHIPSHRPPAAYHEISEIPTDPRGVQQQYQEFSQLLQGTYSSGNIRNPGIIQKKSIISLALFGPGNENVQPNYEFQSIFTQFQNVLRKLLPEEIGFRRLEVRMPEVVLVTSSGDFSLDAMSGGVNALFGMAWQIHLFGHAVEKCTVTIDEPENHLHPSMQRSLLPNLAKAFPFYRFIIATHSPFIVSSFPEAAVYGLVFDEEKRVNSRRLSEKELSGTPNKVLREILDVPSNLPLWVEKEIQLVMRESTELDIREKANQIMKRLKELGLAESISEYREDETPD